MKSTAHTFSKAFVFALLLLVLFVSCKKYTEDKVPPPASNVTYFSFSGPGSHRITIDSFNYDADGRLTRFQFGAYDSTVGFNLMFGSDIAFSYSGSSATTPSGYILNGLNNGNKMTTESHALYYDSQNRIVKDSLLNPPLSIANIMTLGVVANYHYGGNLVVCNIFDYTSTGFREIQTDSLVTDASGNVSSLTYYFLNSPELIFHVNSFSNYANPLYNKTIANSIGPALSMLFAIDFISPYAVKQIVYNNSTIPPISNYAWITDAKGRIIKNQPAPYAFDYIVRYNN